MFSDELMLLAALFGAHLLADFYLQPQSWIADRKRHLRSIALLAHSLVHSGCYLLVLLWWNQSYGWGWHWPQTLLATLALGGSHYLIDLAKSFAKNSSKIFLLDQLLHLIMILLVWGYYCDGFIILQSFWPALNKAEHLAVLLAYLWVLKPCSVLIQLLLQSWHAALPGQQAPQTLPAAGHHIGMLERLLILTFVLLEEYAGIGFLLAAKSVFRFGDLTRAHETKLTEYVMLGTLLSVTFSFLPALLLRLLF
jgi:hypothetical protein